MKSGLDSSLGIQPFKLPLFLKNINSATMDKGTHFNVQPMFGKLISSLDKQEILKFSRVKKEERNVKHFDA